MYKFGGSLPAQGLASCPFTFRSLAFPSDWTKNFFPMSLDAYQCVCLNKLWVLALFPVWIGRIRCILWGGRFVTQCPQLN